MKLGGGGKTYMKLVEGGQGIYEAENTLTNIKEKGLKQGIFSRSMPWFFLKKCPRFIPPHSEPT